MDIIDAIGESLAKPHVGRKPVVPALAVVRALSEADQGQSAKAITSPAPLVQQLRDSHHAIARLVAEGRRPYEVAAMTGYSTARISTLQQDPAFAELVEFYRQQTEEVYLDAHRRLATLGLSATAVLQERLDDRPESFTNKDLKELLGEAFDRSIAPTKSALAKPQQGNGGGTTVVVSFAPAPVPQGAIIDVTPKVDK
jgi:hypothetical protein